MLVCQHVHLVLDGHSESEELVSQGRGAEEGGALGVGDLVARDGGLGGQFDGVVVELLEGNGVQVVGFLGIVCGDGGGGGEGEWKMEGGGKRREEVGRRDVNGTMRSNNFQYNR